MNKILLLLALAITGVHGADRAEPFPFLEAVPAERFAETANRIEYQNLAQLPGDTVLTRYYYLAPGRNWVAWAKQGDHLARAWHGNRRVTSDRSVGIDLVERWADADNHRAAALVISVEPVDNKGHYLLAWLELLPAAVRQDANATLQVMRQALADGDSARMAALIAIPDHVIHKTAYREALQPCLHAHLGQIRGSHADRRGDALRLRMRIDGKKRTVTLPLQKTADGYAFVLDREAFSHCQNLPE